MPLPLDLDCLSVEAIQACAVVHGLVIDEPEQIEFLTRLDSLDVQAAPGCGKTTLTALKLCLLARGWQSSTQGMCILSHTNVAKHQIMAILERDEAGGKLLRYPHFIGTIQSFATTFLALPFLRSRGVDVRSIDDDFYAEAAQSEFRKKGNSYPTLHTLVNPPKPRKNIEPLIRTSHYVWVNGDMKTYGRPSGKRMPFRFGATAASTIEFLKIKQAMTDRGIFCYADMIAYAAQYLYECPCVMAAIQYRFPFLLIDEMQDTSNEQEVFLSGLLPSSACTVQRVGDVNQHIYSEDQEDEESSTAFPSDPVLDLPRSKRFGEHIANAASALTYVRAQKIVGNPDRPKNHPVLFLFEEESIAEVLPAFGRMVLDEVPQIEIAKYPVKALGSRRKSDSSEFPRRLDSYYSAYFPKPKTSSRPLTLLHAILGVQARRDLEWKERSDMLWDACCELLHRWKFVLNGRRPSPMRLRGQLSKADAVHYLRVRKSLLRAISIDCTCPATWDQFASELCEGLKAALNLGDAPALAIGFCAHKSFIAIEAGAPVKPSESVRVLKGDQSLEVELTTIHAAKGETHAATLVLECYAHVHDLKEVLPIIVGEQDSKRISKTKNIPPAIRCTFVGMTRPRNLLAFAVRKDHLGTMAAAYIAAGWRVVDLTTAMKTVQPPP